MLTLINVDKKNKKRLSLIDFEQLLALIATDDAKSRIADIRLCLPLLGEGASKYQPIQQLPLIYPAAEYKKDKADNILFKSSNGLLLLSADNLKDAEDVKNIKELAAQLPMTQFAIEGVDGRSVKIIVRISLKDRTLPKDEESSLKLYKAALPQAIKLYSAMLPAQLSADTGDLNASFRRTLDSTPYYNIEASPLLIDIEAVSKITSTSSPSATQIGTSSDKPFAQTDYSKYADNEFLYTQAADQVRNKMKLTLGESNAGAPAYYSALAAQLCIMQMPKEEAIKHIFNHSWDKAKEDVIRSIVDAAYEENQESPKENTASQIRKSVQNMVDFLLSKYVFRYNTIMGYTEFRPNNSYVESYLPADTRVINRFAIEARLAGIDVWTKDITRYIQSDFIPSYNPIDEFLDQCRGKWDGRDRIRELARTVPTDNPHWENWFYTWFLSMVNQWGSSIFACYGNSVAPLFISPQGYNKSTFCRNLLPPELRWGYNDNLQINDKKQVLQAMSQFLLINLDEFNQISPELQQGFLKNVIQLATVKIKRPYGKQVEEFPRTASFIATSNMSDILTDPTGNRRFIGVEMTGPIDTSYIINYEQLYAQALKAISNGERTYFDAVQTKLIMDNNDQFAKHSDVESYFLSNYQEGNAEESTWKTAADIYKEIMDDAKSTLKPTTITLFGRFLSGIAKLPRKRSNRGTIYSVKRIK